jgi:hypothetical protein
MKIYQAVQKLLVGDTQTDRQTEWWFDKPISIFILLSKNEVGLSNHQSVCLCPPPLITSEPLGKIFMKSGTEVMPFKGTSMQ